jgi:hypothetical protein
MASRSRSRSRSRDRQAPVDDKKDPDEHLPEAHLPLRTSFLPVKHRAGGIIKLDAECDVTCLTATKVLAFLADAREAVLNITNTSDKAEGNVLFVHPQLCKSMLGRVVKFSVYGNVDFHLAPKVTEFLESVKTAIETHIPRDARLSESDFEPVVVTPAAAKQLARDMHKK